MAWHRYLTGYLSDDERWFLERGGNLEGPRGGLDLSRNTWCIWTQVSEDGHNDPSIEYTAMGSPYSAADGDYVRGLVELTLADNYWAGDKRLYAYKWDAGSYAEAKYTVEILVAEQARKENLDLTCATEAGPVL